MVSSRGNRTGTTEAGVRAAVVGLGVMGLAMASRLAGGFRVTACDVSTEREAAAQAAGTTVVASAAAAAAEADVVVVAVRTAEQAEVAIFGNDGVVDGIAGDGVVVLTSTVGTSVARSIGVRLHDRQIMFVDLPVSGGLARAASGNLVAFAGGSAQAIARARPIIDQLASTVVVIGPEAGDGQSMKTVNQLLCGVHIAAAAEAMALARAYGLDLTDALDALDKGAAASFMLADRGPRIAEVLEGQTPDVRSRLDIFVKDMEIVSEAGRSMGISLPVASAAERLYGRARLSGLEAADDSAVANVLMAPYDE